MRSSEEYAGLAEKAVEDANALANDMRPDAAFKTEQLRVEAQVWAALAIAASNLGSARR